MGDFRKLHIEPDTVEWEWWLYSREKGETMHSRESVYSLHRGESVIQEDSLPEDPQYVAWASTVFAQTGAIYAA